MKGLSQGRRRKKGKAHRNNIDIEDPHGRGNEAKVDGMCRYP